MLGHLASSHTVANFNSRTSFFTLWNDFPLGIELLTNLAIWHLDPFLLFPMDPPTCLWLSH